MPIHVTSEIGPLRRVLLQRPGRELEHLSPETMEQLLFDDIPFLHRAQQEHDRFAELLRENGFEDASILMLRSTGDPAELNRSFRTSLKKRAAVRAATVRR